MLAAAAVMLSILIYPLPDVLDLALCVMLT